MTIIFIPMIHNFILRLRQQMLIKPLITCWIENCVAAIRNWMISNEMKLNQGTTEIMFICSVYLHLHSTSTLEMKHYRVLLQYEIWELFLMSMSFDAHITGICKSSFYHLRNLSRIRQLTKETITIAMHALVLSKFDYCNSFFFGPPKHQLKKLQYVQNSAAQIACSSVWQVSSYNACVNW